MAALEEAAPPGPDGGEVAPVLVGLEMGWRTAFLPSLAAFLFLEV